MLKHLIKAFFFVWLQVKIWFQNRRTKWKKQEGITNAEAAEHKIGGERHIDTMRRRQMTQAVTTSPQTGHNNQPQSLGGSLVTPNLGRMTVVSPPSSINRDDASSNGSCGVVHSAGHNGLDSNAQSHNRDSCRASEEPVTQKQMIVDNESRNIYREIIQIVPLAHSSPTHVSRAGSSPGLPASEVKPEVTPQSSNRVDTSPPADQASPMSTSSPPPLIQPKSMTQTTSPATSPLPAHQPLPQLLSQILITQPAPGAPRDGSQPPLSPNSQPLDLKSTAP